MYVLNLLFTCAVHLKTQYSLYDDSKVLLMPCPLTGPKMFWSGPNFLCQIKDLFTFCGSHKIFVPDKEMICTQ